MRRKFAQRFECAGPDEAAAILSARLQAVLEQTPLTLLTSVLIAALSALVLAPLAGLGITATWLGAIAGLTLLRWWSAQRFAGRDGPAPGDAPRLIAGAVANGALWGLGALVIPWHLESARFFLAFVIGGLCAGTSAVNSAYYPVVVGFVLPATLPFALAFARHGTRESTISALMVVIFALAFAVFTWLAHQGFGRRVALQFRLEQRDRALSAANAQLEAEIRERRDVEARLQHAQKMEAIGRLASGIAHDFNNVIQVVEGGASVIRERAADPDIQRLATRIGDAAARGASVTRRLLAFARPGELRAAPFALADMAASLRDILESGLGAAIAMDLQLSPGLPPVLADRAQLETVLVNLATNARDAMPRGGRLCIEARHARDLPPELSPGRYVELRVSDTGTGMPPDVLGRATEPFFTTKPAGQGTGLGLAIARAFAEQSGGALRLESHAGGGTTVFLFLPEAAPAPPAAAVAPCPTAPPAARLVLLVDDDPVVREVLAEQLAMRGYAVETAPGGEAALERLAAGLKPAILLTDLSMPDLDGIGLIRATEQAYPRLPVILLTGHPIESAAIGAVRCPFRLMRKPASSELLARSIEALLAGNPG